jgi:hypothetical protein
MSALTFVSYLSTVVMFVFVVPFTTFYYEGEDNEENEDSGGR